MNSSKEKPGASRSAVPFPDDAAFDGPPAGKRPFSDLQLANTPVIEEGSADDDGRWTGFGHYMGAKKRKLLEQFSDAARDIVPQSGESTSKLFHGVSVHVNGSTHPSSDEIKRLMMLHGGQYHLYYNSRTTSHIIASNLPYTKIVQLKAERVVRPEWITESIRAGKLLPWRTFELYPMHDKQDQTHVTSNWLQPDHMMHHQNQPDHVTKEQKHVAPSQNQRKTPNHVVSISPQPSHVTTVKTAPYMLPPAVASTSRRDPAPLAMKAGDANYVNQFFARSRLHHLSMWKVEAKQLVERLQGESDGTFPGRERLRHFYRGRVGNSGISDQVVMHIDFDCFFVSVGLLSRPGLVGKPVACCHGRSGYGKLDGVGREGEMFNSKSEVASCNYVARQAGLKNGMYLGPAKRMCPDLVTIPYEFEEYKRIFTIFYETVASYTLDIEAISCDEMLVDCTELLRDVSVAPVEFAAFLREEIREKAGGCHASAGLASNSLLARLATKKAKPNGHFYVSPEEVASFLVSVKISDLPGVGYSAVDKFAQLNVRTCGEARKIGLGKMQAVFGQKIGKKFYNYARGVDEHQVRNETTRKSVSAEINYGMRMTEFADFKRFFGELCGEVASRLKKAAVKSSLMTLKVLVRHPDAPVEPEKYMGCGQCNAVNKSASLTNSTDSADSLTTEGLLLFRKMALDVKEVRGLGIQMTRLVPTKKSRTNPPESAQPERLVKVTHSVPMEPHYGSPGHVPSEEFDAASASYQSPAFPDIPCGQPERDFDEMNDSDSDSPVLVQEPKFDTKPSPPVPTVKSYYSLEADVGWDRIYRKLAVKLRQFLSERNTGLGDAAVGVRGPPMFTQPEFREKVGVKFDLPAVDGELGPDVSFYEDSVETAVLGSASTDEGNFGSGTPNLVENSATDMFAVTPSPNLDEEFPLTQPGRELRESSLNSTVADEVLDAAAESVEAQMLTETECKFWLNHFSIPENFAMTEFPSSSHGATLTYLDQPKVTRSTTLNGKALPPLVTWVIWKMNVVYGDEWLQFLMGDQLLLKDIRQAQLRLETVTASQTKRQIGRELRLKGDYPIHPGKTGKTQSKLNLEGSGPQGVGLGADFPSASQVDPEFLAAMPTELLDEIFEMYSRAARSRPEKAASKPPARKTRKKVDKVPPNQPSISAFVKPTRSSQETKSSTQSTSSDIVTLDSDGEEVFQLESPKLDESGESDEYAELQTPDSPMLFGETDVSEIQPILADFIEKKLPDEHFIEAVLTFCRGHLTEGHLSCVDGFLRFFHREVDFMESDGKEMWIDGYTLLVDMLQVWFHENFDSGLFMPSFFASD